MGTLNQIDERRQLISFEEASTIVPLHHTTFRQRKAGTEDLTHVRLGRRVFLIRSEVEVLAQKIIKSAKAENEHRKTLLRLAS